MFGDNGSFLLAMFELFIFCAWFMCLFWVVGDVFRSKDLGAWGKTGWIAFLVFLPLLGMLVYLIARGSGMSDRTLEAHAEAQARQEAYIQRVATSSPNATNATTQITSAKSLLDAGAISPIEYEQLKAEALRQPLAPTVPTAAR